MGVDINTYRCRVGVFFLHHGGGVLMMPLHADYSMLAKLIGCLSFVRILLVMAGIEQNPGPTDQYIFRYQYLLIEVGTKVLKGLFDNIVGTDIMLYLNANNQKQYDQLQFIINKTKILSDRQKEHLPPIEMKPNSADFDITLLACLLRNICGLRKHDDLVWTSPAPKDLSLEADITRIRECRNNLAHMETVLLDENDLKNKWQELTLILHRLNQSANFADLASLISKAECMANDEIDKQNIQNDILEIYKHRFKTLPVSPLFENVDEDLLQIYQSPDMHSVEPTKKGPEQVTEGKSKQIECYEQIFCKDSKICNHIYITGDAGVGKTSFCRHLCFLWYMAKCSIAVDNEVLKKDVDYISKFDYVFYITLRETRLINVLDMIINQLFGSYEKYKVEQIKSLLRDKQCLILLDGMDEWSPENVEVKVPEKVHSENCVYLTTCRPYRLESVRLSHKKDIDQRIQMTGISGRSSESYIQKVVDNMNQEKSFNKKSSDFVIDVKKCGLIKQLCIPMIASHLVVLWNEKTLTGMSRAVIYANILEMLFKRAEKRKIQSPPSTTSSYQLPNSLSKLKYLNKYVAFIFKVSYLSFCSIFKKDENVMSLVFTRDQLESEPYFFSIEETDFLCKIGILSRNEVFGFYLEEKMKLSFIHASYLEFFAALFISSFDSSNSFTDITKTWNCLNDVLPRGNLLLLLAGFSYGGMKQLFDNMYLQISDDLTLCRRNAIFHYKWYSYRDQIKSLQNIVVNCFKEFSRSKTTKIKMEDFIFDDYSMLDDDSSVDIFIQLLLLNTKCVKSIHSVEGKYYPQFGQIHCLQYLNVGNLSSGNIEKFTQCMLQNTSTLHTVCIEGDYKDKPLIPELLVRNLHHLTSLSLSKVKIQHNSLYNLVEFLSNNFLIENIKLSSVFCNNHRDDDSDCTLTLNLLKHTKLTSLDLRAVNILCNNVNNSSLKYITLSPLSERIVRLCYIDLFNCIKNSQLEHLYINGSRVYMSDNTMKTLTSTVKTLPCIKLLGLCDMKLLDDVLLQLHPHVTQVEIKLWFVTMSRQCFHCFVESCVNKKSEIKVVLYRCKITSDDGETHSVLSRKESLNFMSEHLESFSTINITYKDEKWLHFETTKCQ